MYRHRGGGGSSKSEMVGGKRINDALDKQLDKSLASTSRALKDKTVPSTSTVTGKLHQRHPNHHMDHQHDTLSSSTPTTKNKCSDGKDYLLC